jgi:hypothetical protein
MMPTRLFEIANDEAQMDEWEYAHLETCRTCYKVYRKLIIQVERARAGEKPKGGNSV